MNKETVEKLIQKLTTLQSNLILLGSEIAQIRTDILKAETKEENHD